MSRVLLIITAFLFLMSVKSKLLVVQPLELANRFPGRQIHASYANFGIISSGFSSMGRLYYSSKSSETLPNYACYDLKDVHLDFNPSDIDYYPVILVDKGNCSFVDMARNIQTAGGYMALIINDKPGNVKNYPVNEDGYGDDIVIPTLMIGQEDGRVLKNYIKNDPDANIQLEIEFSSNKGDEVVVDLYMHVNDENAYYMLKEFKPFYELLKDNITFNPIYITHDLGQIKGSSIENSCVSNGKYCLDPTMPLDNFASGRSLVLDSVFHQCLYNILLEDKKNPKEEVYFEFANEYYSNCLYSSKYQRFCGSSILEDFGVSKDKIFSCIADSFGVSHFILVEKEINNDNKILRANYDKLIENKIKVIPALDINGKRMKGRMDGENLFINICNSFNKKPKVCLDYFLLPTTGSRIKWYHVVLIIIGVVGINLLVLFVCRKYLIKRVQERISTDEIDLDGRINSVVSSYLALRDKKTDTSVSTV